MSNVDKLVLKSAVNGFYTIQKSRIQIGNALVANFKEKLGQDAGATEETLDIDAEVLLSSLRKSYKRITDGVTRMNHRTFKRDGHISTFSELALVEMYTNLLTDEQEAEKKITHAVKEFPLHTQFLENVKGCGPLMSSVIIGGFDIYKAEYPSSLHAYAGLDVVKGEGRSRQKHHLVDQTYTDADGETQTKKGISFNPFIKTKLIGVLGPCMIKAQGSYSEVYYDYKNRLESNPAHQDKTKGHRHNMAVRYMIKRFLVDLYKEWRTLEGLPVADEYSKAKLNITHKAA